MPLNHDPATAAARWADTYGLRLEQAMEDHWHDLDDRLRSALGNLSLAELSLGPGKDFGPHVIEPAVQAWIERFFMPIFSQAADDFRATLQFQPDWQHHAPRLNVQAEGALDFQDVLKALLIPGGVAIGAGTLATAITTATTTWLFVWTTTTVIVGWPLLIAGLLVGGFLLALGVYNVSDLRRTLEDRFQRHLTPQLRDLLIGAGTTHQGKHVPSLREQLQQQFRHIAAASCARPPSGDGE